MRRNLLFFFLGRGAAAPRYVDFEARVTATTESAAGLSVHRNGTAGIEGTARALGSTGVYRGAGALSLARGESRGAPQGLRQPAAWAYVPASELTGSPQALRGLAAQLTTEATARSALGVLQLRRCYGGRVELAVVWGGQVTAATVYGGSVAPAISYGGTVEPVTINYEGTVAPAVLYGGSVECCCDE